MIGPRQPMNSCSPPKRGDQLVAGLEEQVKRVAEHHVVAERRDLGRRHARAPSPLVASGTKAGVRTSPCAVRSTPVRARPPGRGRGSPGRASRHRIARAVLASIVDSAGNSALPLDVPARSCSSPSASRCRARRPCSPRRSWPASGQFPIEAVIVLAALAAIIGDNIGYRDRPRVGPPAPVGARPVPRPSPGRAAPRRPVLREARPQGGLPRALLRRAADRRRVAGRDQPDALAHLPDLERARRHRLGDGLRPAGLLHRQRRGEDPADGRAGRRRLFFLPPSSSSACGATAPSTASSRR